jgi:hypothetical protein
VEIVNLLAICSALHAVILLCGLCHEHFDPQPTLQSQGNYDYVQTSIRLVLSINKRSRNEWLKWVSLYLFGRRLLAEAERLVATVESHELGLEHGVTVDLETSTLVALDTAEASGVGLVDGGEGDHVSGNLGHVGVADGNGHVGESGGTWVDETTDLGVELGALDLGVVGFGDTLVDEKERCTSVGNGVRALGVLEELVTDGKFGGGELPETGLSLDGDPGHLTLKLGSINLAKLVDTCAIGVQVGSEDGHVKASHDVVEEGLCGSLLGTIVDSVEAGEGESDETISVGILDERLRDGVGQLNSLALNLDSADSNSVCANNSSGTGAITVADLPLLTSGRLEGSGLRGIEGCMLADGSLIKLSAEHPPALC